MPIKDIPEVVSKPTTQESNQSYVPSVRASAFGIGGSGNGGGGYVPSTKPAIGSKPNFGSGKGPSIGGGGFLSR